jgi:hypothetical protein
METPSTRTNPHLPSEVRALTYEYLGYAQPNTICMQLYEFGEIEVGIEVRDFLTCSSLAPTGVLLSIESLSRTRTLEQYVELHPATYHQKQQVQLGPAIDMVSLSFRFFHQLTWDAVDWATYYQEAEESRLALYDMIDKIDNIEAVVCKSDMNWLFHLFEGPRSDTTRPAYYGKESARVLRIKMSFDHAFPRAYYPEFDERHIKQKIEKEIAESYEWFAPSDEETQEETQEETEDDDSEYEGYVHRNNLSRLAPIHDPMQADPNWESTVLADRFDGTYIGWTIVNRRRKWYY